MEKSSKEMIILTSLTQVQAVSCITWMTLWLLCTRKFAFYNFEIDIFSSYQIFISCEATNEMLCRCLLAIETSILEHIGEDM